jgi:hypothetical protein
MDLYILREKATGCVCGMRIAGEATPATAAHDAEDRGDCAPSARQHAAVTH